jgi:hypothetical protein
MLQVGWVLLCTWGDWSRFAGDVTYRINYLGIFGIEEEQSEGMCPVIGYNLITSYFEVTLFDIFVRHKVAKYFTKEKDLWRFVYVILEVLEFNRVRKIRR